MPELGGVLGTNLAGSVGQFWEEGQLRVDDLLAGAASWPWEAKYRGFQFIPIQVNIYLL